jgi:DNA (cytosine-5)-methyltransferase 1
MWDEVSFTIQAGGRHAPCHPSAPPFKFVEQNKRIFEPGYADKYRRLTVREAALIQTFPPSCLLTKPNKKATGKAYKPIGNAVPPLLGYLVARKVREILDSSTVQTLPPT